MQLQFNLTQQSTQEIEPGYCHCGCGQLAPIRRQTDTKRKYIKGQPAKFINGHQNYAGKGVRPLEDRFWEKVDRRGADDCWEWTGGKNVDGYGQIAVDGRATPAHRISYELRNGPIHEGLQCLHRCDNPTCVNPNHLFLGTHQDNMDDMYSKGRRPPRKGEQQRSAKLTEALVLEIRSRKERGEPQCALAKKFGITRSTVSKIILRRIWKHI